MSQDSRSLLNATDQDHSCEIDLLGKYKEADPENTAENEDHSTNISLPLLIASTCGLGGKAISL